MGWEGFKLKLKIATSSSVFVLMKNFIIRFCNVTNFSLKGLVL